MDCRCRYTVDFQVPPIFVGQGLNTTHRAQIDTTDFFGYSFYTKHVLVSLF